MTDVQVDRGFHRDVLQHEASEHFTASKMLPCIPNSIPRSAIRRHDLRAPFPVHAGVLAAVPIKRTSRASCPASQATLIDKLLRSRIVSVRGKHYILVGLTTKTRTHLRLRGPEGGESWPAPGQSGSESSPC